MSLSDVRPFFRTRFEGLGFTEHQDAFSVNNIGEAVLDDSFHIESGVVSSVNEPLTHIFTYPILVRIFKKGFADPIDALDAIDQTRADILDDILDPANRLQTTGINNVEFIDSSTLPLDDSNDNAIVLELNFNATVILCFND